MGGHGDAPSAGRHTARDAPPVRPSPTPSAEHRVAAYIGRPRTTLTATPNPPPPFPNRQLVTRSPTRRRADPLPRPSTPIHTDWRTPISQIFLPPVCKSLIRYRSLETYVKVARPIDGDVPETYYQRARQRLEFSSIRIRACSAASASSSRKGRAAGSGSKGFKG